MRRIGLAPPQYLANTALCATGKTACHADQFETYTFSELSCHLAQILEMQNGGLWQLNNCFDWANFYTLALNAVRLGPMAPQLH